MKKLIKETKPIRTGCSKAIVPPAFWFKENNIKKVRIYQSGKKLIIEPVIE